MFRTGLEGHKPAALCSPFPCSKLLLSFVWTDPVHTFPLSFQRDMESLTSPQQGKNSSHLCWSSHFLFPSSIHIILKQILPCNAKFAKASVSSWELWKNVINVMSSWVCLETVYVRGWVQYANLQSSYLYSCQGPYCPSSVSPPPQPVPWAVVVGSTEYEGCTAIKQPRELLERLWSVWAHPTSLLCSVSGIDTGELSEPPWGAVEQEGLRLMDGCVPVQDGIRQVCRLLVLSCQCLSYPVREIFQRCA